ncbi:hypothetical protein PVAP13_9KG443700 [Panicum virgatum]|uniref:Uncharacterized protein n=1 Tax=Panicum virgatum TaxID=38727 RepID=A0A8T0NPP6_PANVG|nr:hypothetical protein PVAP13_9KG443700 [Panicum virgatum]
MKERARVREEEVRQIVRETFASSSDMALKLELVDTLQRIGVSYRYGEEIDELLRAVHRNARQHQEGRRDDDDHLYVTSLRFYLLRKHGYSVSSDVFVKFRDDQGNFASDDVNALVMLHDAVHLRTRGEEALDSAVTFTKIRLQSVMDSLEPELAEEVRCTLETPRYRKVQRVEARRYLSLDYTILHAQYCDELRSLTITKHNYSTDGGKDLRSRADLRFARERVPQYSYSRILLTKFFKLVSLIDDFCDSYSTTEESEKFTMAIERWDEQEAELFTAYMKALYINVLHNINDIIQELKLQKKSHAELVKELLIDMTQCYHAEVKWRDERYVPAKVEEHLQLSAPSSACMRITNLAFISLGDVTTREDIDWREQASEHVVSTVQTCMKEYGFTVEQAKEKLGALIDEAWMDIVEECLDGGHPMALLEKAVNLARGMDHMYKRDDAYTFPLGLKDAIASTFVDSM